MHIWTFWFWILAIHIRLYDGENKIAQKQQGERLPGREKTQLAPRALRTPERERRKRGQKPYKESSVIHRGKQRWRRAASNWQRGRETEGRGREREKRRIDPLLQSKKHHAIKTQKNKERSTEVRVRREGGYCSLGKAEERSWLGQGTADKKCNSQPRLT